MRFDLVTLNLVLAVAESRSITQGAQREHLALAAVLPAGHALAAQTSLNARLQVRGFDAIAQLVLPAVVQRFIESLTIASFALPNPAERLLP